MSRTNYAAVWFAWGVLVLLMCGTDVRAGWKEVFDELAHPVIATLEFEGTDHFSTNELAKYTNLAVGKKFDAATAAEDCAAIVRHYQEHGYPFATCAHGEHSNKSDLCRRLDGLVYTIHEGPRVKVRRVEFTGNNFVGDDALLDQIASHKRGSSRANFAEVPADVVRLAEYYRSFGYRDVVVSYELQWNLDGGDALLMFHIEEGERY